MTTEAKRGPISPLPWHWEEMPTGRQEDEFWALSSANEYEYVIGAADGRVYSDYTSDSATIECKRADAEFIVRACNAHDELAAALRTIRDITSPGLAAASKFTDMDPRERLADIWAKASAALARATGE